jgi:hypothetical protein
MNPIRKYPRTHHLEGSRLQPGDEDLHSVSFSTLKGRFLIVEEKCDGANCGISFDAAGKLWLQSRGHFLTGGVREKHFNLFKQWAAAHAHRLWPVLLDRFVMYGEWVYAKHTIFYDQLPHYFLEFDMLDTQTGVFLSTERRRQLLAGLPVVSVPVLWTGAATSLEELVALVGPSLYKSADWRRRLREVCGERGLDAERVERETDPADAMEGLYLKVEEPAGPAGVVVERYKWIRASFLTSVVDSGSHWLSRPIVPNQLRTGVDLFGERP